MRKVTSLDEYYALVKAAKARAGSLNTNSAFFPDTIQRYIFLGRLFYEEIDSGILFFTDEENFYQAYYYFNAEIPLSIQKKDKPLLLQNIYRGNKKPWLKKLEVGLIQSGFKKEDVLKHGVFIGYDNIPKIRRSMENVKRIFKKEGLVYSPLRKDQISEMLAFQKTITEIPFYQFPYFTDTEYEEEANAERLCCVMDASGRIVAARHLILNGKKAYGWVGIEDKYKARYGIALVFLHHAFDYIERNDVKMCSWVKTTNTPSLQYHERLGTEWTGHIEEEWLLI